MKTEHTEGPWSATTRNTHRTPAGVELICITVMPAGDYRGPVADMQSCDHIQGISMAECEANARLIAAAPDLVAALIECADMLEIYADGHLCDALNEARAAIAKATIAP